MIALRIMCATQGLFLYDSILAVVIILQALPVPTLVILCTPTPVQLQETGCKMLQPNAFPPFSSHLRNESRFHFGVVEICAGITGQSRGQISECDSLFS